MASVIEDAIKAMNDLSEAIFTDEIWFNLSLARVASEQAIHFTREKKQMDLIWRTYDQACMFLHTARQTAARVSPDAVDWVEACHDYTDGLMRSEMKAYWNK